MADNNPFDMISSMLSNPDAMNKVGALFGNKQEEENQPMPDFSLPKLNFNDEDNGTRLLHALEPFLSSRRKSHIPQMLQAMQIGKMMGGFRKK